MRLLNVRTFELEEYYGPLPLPYAILSHVWGDEEVLYQHMKGKRSSINDLPLEVRPMTGFRKIELACQQALDDGYCYIWIDTCCIDKSSSAELSEAINSMYAWYRDAAICYAYLEDVPPYGKTVPILEDSELLTQEEEEHLLQLPFSKSNWFKRGWTLQELIAPKEVTFYDNAFDMIGSRRQMAYLVEQITGIDETLLVGDQGLNTFCVARKMSWAAGRVTTRSEDRAYSLFGLFDINMPLLYGEGEEAFRRLQVHILESSTDESLFAWNIEGKDQRRLLAPSPDHFRECGRIVQWLGDQLPTEARRMTNKGLEVRLPLLVRWSGDISEKIAVLRCRYEDNLLGPVGLRLHNSASTLGLPLARSGSRLCVLPQHHVMSTDLKLARIMETEKNHDMHQAVPNLKCLLTFKGFEGEVCITAMYPRRCWNLTTRTFTPGRGSRITAGLRIEQPHERPCDLLFGYKSQRESYWFNDEWVALENATKDRALDEVCLTAHKVRERQDGVSQMTTTEQGNFEASIQSENTWVEKVFRLTVTQRLRLD